EQEVFRGGVWLDQIDTHTTVWLDAGLVDFFLHRSDSLAKNVSIFKRKYLHLNMASAIMLMYYYILALIERRIKIKELRSQRMGTRNTPLEEIMEALQGTKLIILIGEQY
ncbi:hypothetical protein ACJX0J_027094, partial [Zea mays]